MRKITSLLMALLFVATTAMAQNYEPRNNGTKNGTDRCVSQVSLTSGAYGESSYDLTSAEQMQDWTDKTASVVFIAAPGETVTVAAQTTGSWVHYSVFIDVDADGFTTGIEAGSSWKPVGDLVAYSFYNNDGASDASGWNSVGDVVSGDARNKPAIPAFAVPSVVGTYRMRIVQDWCSIDPAGDADGKFSDFKANRGQIIDVTLEVAEAPAAPLVEEGKLYTLECRSGAAHSTERFIADNGTVISGQAAEGTTFSFESAGDGGYYMKSTVSNKYLSYTATEGIHTTDGKVTSWVLAAPDHTPGVVTLTVGDDKYLNNNGSDCTNSSTTNLKANYHNGGPGAGNACSLWELKEYTEPAPEVAEPINSIAQLSNFKAYTATLPNHQAHATGWAVNTTDLKSIVYDLGLTQKNDDPNQQFAFLTPDEGATYYLYSVGQSKYISNTGKLTESPTHPIVFKNGNRAGTFVVWFDKNHIANVGGSGQMAIDDWGPDGVWGNADNGNSIVITPVDDFDPTDALSKFVTSLPDPIKASDFAAEKVYVIKNVSNSRSGYLYVGSDNALCIGNLDDLNNIPNNYLFKSMPTNSGLVLKAVEGGYVPTGDGSGANLSATTVSKAAVVTVAAKGGTFPETTLNMLVNNNYCNVNPGALCTWNDVNDANGVWEFYAVEEIANCEAAQMTSVTTLAEQALTLDGVGYPVASERENLNNTVAAAKAFNTSGAWYEEMVNTLTAYASTTNINLPEDGKAYTFTNVHPNATYGQRYLYYNEDGVLSVASRGTETAEELPVSAKFICKQLEDGRFVFVNNNGKYLVWRGKDDGTNNHTGGVDAYDNDYCPMTFVKMVLNGANTNAATSIQDLFGLVAFGGKRNATQNSYFLTSNNNNPIFNQDGSWVLRYANDHSTAFKVEEVSFPNKPVVKDAQGVENVAAISTFCAPFATVAPSNVEVYIAASDENHYIKLQKVEGAVPANTGVVLVSTDDALVGQAVTMVPATTETLADVTGNLLRGDAAKADYTVDAAVNAYVLGAVDGVAGFYPLSTSDRTIKQGKAYLELDASLSAVKLYFGGDEATGIETVVKENANAPIFDLSGRRVVNVAKGGIYIQNGKKFIVK